MKIRKGISSLLAVVLCVALLAVSASAYAQVETDRDVSLKLSYVHSDRNDFPVAGMKVSLYKVYDMSDVVRFTATEAFSNAYAPGVEGSTGDFDFNLDHWNTADDNGNQTVDWNTMASTLESLLLRDAAAEREDMPQPVRTGTTGEDGSITFASEEGSQLTAGLYLVMGDAIRIDNYTYTPQTFLVSLPHLDENDEWVYDLAASGKMSITHHSSGGGKISLSALKVWEDEDSDVQRPTSVRVQLLHNDQEYGSPVTLNEGNSWSHTWSDLSDGGRWSIAEVSVPDDYTVSVSREGSTFVVTNSALTNIDPDDVPEGENPDIDDGTGDPGSGSGTGDPDLPEIDIPEDGVPTGGLPNTGTLWWAVPILTLAGIAMFSFGWIGYRRGRKTQDEA